MTPLRFLQGDATSPQAKGPKVIAHISNECGERALVRKRRAIPARELDSHARQRARDVAVGDPAREHAADRDDEAREEEQEKRQHEGCRSKLLAPLALAERAAQR